MKITALIPARYNASRFPGKLMRLLGDKPVIRHVYDAVIGSGLFDSVFVVTDSDLIFNELAAHGGAVLMSQKDHESGSDRIAEALASLETDIVVNIQGDEPFINKEALEKIISAFGDSSVLVASLMRKVKREDAEATNFVKVVVDKNSDALYFSRYPIPYPRNLSPFVFLHIGVYGYRKEVLLRFTSWPVSDLEKTEALEQLRYLENGIKIKMIESNYRNVSIDTPEDLERAQQLFNAFENEKTNEKNNRLP